MKNRAHRLPVYDAARDIKEIQKQQAIVTQKAGNSALQTYTPVWASSGTQPVLGTGTLQGTYRRDGLMCWANIVMRANTGTTFGTGFWTFTLPFQGSTFAGSPPDSFVGSALGYSGSAWTGGSCMYWDPTANTVIALLGSGVQGAGNGVPFAWTTSGYLILTMYYPTMTPLT